VPALPDADARKLDTGEAYVIVPSYNEATVIRETVQGLLPLGVHVVVVDDGSTDGSIERLRDLPVSVLRHPLNLGQGAALQTGIDFAVADGARYLVTFDADGQHDARDVPRLLQRLVDDDLDIVLGSRFLGEDPNMGVGRRLLLKSAVFFTRLTTRVRVTDVHNGLRAFRVEAAGALRLTQNRMAHASELLASIAASRLRYAETAVAVRYTDYSRAKGQRTIGAVDIVHDLVVRRLFR